MTRRVTSLLSQSTDSKGIAAGSKRASSPTFDGLTNWLMVNALCNTAWGLRPRAHPPFKS